MTNHRYIKMELTERELHCIARLLQGSFLCGQRLFIGCHFCKYQCIDPTSVYMPGYVDVMNKLYKITGVDTRVGSSGRDSPPPYLNGALPYKKLLRNANGKIKAEFQEWSSDLLDKV